MSTPNLALAHIASNQSSKEVTANAALDGLDEAIANRLSLNVAGNADVVLSSAQALGNMMLEFTGALTGNINVKCPNNTKAYIVKNSTSGAFTLTFKTVAGTGIALPSGQAILVFCDGVNVVQVGATSTPLPNSVAYNRQTAQAGNIANTTVYTPGADGFYRISSYLEITTAGTGGSTLTVQFAATDDIGAIGFSQSAVNIGAQVRQASSQTFYAKSGQPIQFGVILTGGAGALQYSITTVVEQLH